MKILGEREIQKYIFDTDFLNEDNEGKCYLYAELLDRLARGKTREESEFSLKEIVYSLYFWWRMYRKFHKMNGGCTDGGMADYQSHIIEMIDHLEGEIIDCDFLQKMEDVIEENDNIDTILKILNP